MRGVFLSSAYALCELCDVYELCVGCVDCVWVYGLNVGVLRVRIMCVLCKRRCECAMHVLCGCRCAYGG